MNLLRQASAKVHDINYKHKYKPRDEANESTKGTVEKATDAEVQAWTDENRYITPKQAKDNYSLDRYNELVTTISASLLKDDSGTEVSTEVLWWDTWLILTYRLYWSNGTDYTTMSAKFQIYNWTSWVTIQEVSWGRQDGRKDTNRRIYILKPWYKARIEVYKESTNSYVDVTWEIYHQ